MLIIQLTLAWKSAELRQHLFPAYRKPPIKPYMLIASTGHSLTHAPHSTQSSLIFALPSSIIIASTGHTFSQLPQPMHFSLSTFAAINSIPFMTGFVKIIKFYYWHMLIIIISRLLAYVNKYFICFYKIFIQHPNHKTPRY